MSSCRSAAAEAAGGASDEHATVEGRVEHGATGRDGCAEGVRASARFALLPEVFVGELLDIAQAE